MHNVKDMTRATHNPKDFDKLIQDGFVDDFVDNILSQNIFDENYYRASSHAHEYVRNIWGRLFEITEIVPDFSNNHQDLIILKKRA